MPFMLKAFGAPVFDIRPPPRHTRHMKRTNLVLDAAVLEEAQLLAGERTYSATVQRALNEFVRRAKARRILDLAGSGGWRGDLAVMRERPPAFTTTDPKSRKPRRGSR